jgi:hypothetical protein
MGCLLAFMVSACGKTGPAGVTGSTGPAGPQGMAGSPGPAGSSIRSGLGAPADTLGLIGDFYIDERAVDLYGPKTASGWGASTPLIGPAGANGANGVNGTAGSQILSGIIPPAAITGVAGDYYFNRTTDSLYGPKTGSGWGTAVSLRGSPGATGAIGATGSANVIFYNWTAFNAGGWSLYQTASNIRFYPLTMPALTSELLNTGVVLVYLQFLDIVAGDTVLQRVFQSPAIFPYGNASPNEQLWDYYLPGEVVFDLSLFSGVGDPGVLSFGLDQAGFYSGYLYRIIFIPGGVAGTGIDLHTRTYKQICSTFGIKP